MITTLTLNPCIDKTLIVPSFQVGEMNRVSESKIVYAGKGFNVSKGIANLGFETTITGFMYSNDAGIALSSIESAGKGKIHSDCVICPGNLRVNVKVFDEKTRKVTEINEPGVPTNEQFVNKIIHKTVELSKQSSYLILSGSIPPKCPVDIYSQIIKSVKENPANKCQIVLDINGAPLKSVFSQKVEINKLSMPDIIKPNKDEFETLVNKKLQSKEEIKKEAIKIINTFGIKIICVSLGGEGAFISDGKESFFAPTVKNIVVKGTVCAGDSLVAGLVTGLAQNMKLKDAFRRAIASATSCVMQGASSVVSQELLNDIIDRVEINEI